MNKFTISANEKRIRESEYTAKVIFEDFLGTQYEYVSSASSDYVLYLGTGNSEKKLIVKNLFLNTPNGLWFRHESLPKQPLEL